MFEPPILDQLMGVGALLRQNLNSLQSDFCNEEVRKWKN